MERIETTILRNLVYEEEYSRKVIPFIQPDYFENRTDKVIFEEIAQFIVKYDAAITIEALNIEIDNRTDLTEDEIRHIGGVLNIEDEVKRVTNTQGDHVKAIYDHKCNNPKFELVVGGEYVNQILKHRGVTVAAERKRIINKAINKYRDKSSKAQNKKWIRWTSSNDKKVMENRVNRQPEGTVAFYNSSLISRKIEHDMLQEITNPDNKEVIKFKAYIYFSNEAAKEKWFDSNLSEGCAELTETFNRLLRMLPEVQIKGANKGDTVPRKWSFEYMETEKDDEEMLSESID